MIYAISDASAGIVVAAITGVFAVILEWMRRQGKRTKKIENETLSTDADNGTTLRKEVREIAQRQIGIGRRQVVADKRNQRWHIENTRRFRRIEDRLDNKRNELDKIHEQIDHLEGER